MKSVSKTMIEGLERAVATYQAHFDQPPPTHLDSLEEDLPYLGLEVQVPISEAIRSWGYPAFRQAVMAAMASKGGTS